MKKILSFILGVLITSLAVRAQVTFSPGTFTAEDEVTLTVDVSGTPMAGKSEAYIWMWANPDLTGMPSPNAVFNGDWGNSSAGAKLTAAGTNKWSFKFTGTQAFGLTPGQLKSFGFLVKAKDGTAQTSDFKPFSFDPLIFTASKLRVFPSKVGRDDVVNLFFERGLGTTVEEQRMAPQSVTITMYDDANAKVGTDLTVPVTQRTSGIWSASFIPSDKFTASAGHKLKRFTYKFNGTVLSTTGGTQNVSSAEGSVDFIEMK